MRRHTATEGIRLMTDNWGQTTCRVVWAQVCFLSFYFYILTYIYISDITANLRRRDSTLQQRESGL